MSELKTYGAIDLGTNNCRLLIARAGLDILRPVDSYSQIVRLGEGVSQNNLLSENAIDKALQALKICAQKLGQNQVDSYRAVTTAACRMAKNCDEFIQKIARDTGLKVDVISPDEEAYLSYLACANILDAQQYKYAIIFDIGGGSTEICWVEIQPFVRYSKRVGYISLPFGVSNLTEKYFDKSSPDYGRLQDVENYIFKKMVTFDQTHSMSDAIANGEVQMIGNSGTITTLAAVHLNLANYDRSKVDGYEFAYKNLLEVSKNLSQMNQAGREANPCIGTDRADLMVAGCFLIETICKYWQLPSLFVADRGLREGILCDLIMKEAQL